MSTHPTLADVEKVEKATYKLLEEIGVPFKRVEKFEWLNEVCGKGAQWCGNSEVAGVIQIYLGCQPGAIAHEIGHGFHEALNHNKRAELPYPFRYDPDPNNANQDGQAVAEAIRYFVEQRLGSTWQPTANKQTLESCQYDFDQFAKAVRSLVI